MSRNDSPCLKEIFTPFHFFEGSEVLLEMLRGNGDGEVAPSAEVLKWKEKGLQSTLLRMRLPPSLPQR